MKRSKIFLLSCTGVVIILLTLFVWFCGAFFRLGLPRRAITVEGKEVTVFVADTPDLREKGLQHIVWMPSDGGMQFVFPEPGRYCFWNKNTYLDLKLIFMRRGKIVETVTLPSFWHGAKTICPGEDVDAVIEINAR